MKKKVLTVTLTLLTVGIFFFIPKVNAADISVLSSFNTSRTDNDVTIYAYGTTLFPFTDSFDSTGSTSPISQTYNHVTHILTVKFINNGSTCKYVMYPYVTVTLTDPNPNAEVSYTTPTNLVNYSNDFYLSFNDADRYFECNPSADWSFGDRICIPPNSTLTAMVTFETRAVFNNPTLSYTCSKISGVVISSSFKAYDTDYTPSGSHQDLLISIEALRAYLTGSTGLPLTNTRLGQVLNYLNPISTNVQDIRDYLYGDSSINNNVSQNSYDLKTQSDNIHAREQAYFTQNSQAIQATGLSNYQFGTVEGNGIGAVSNDFTSIWNALNGWTSVYIFSLTLTLALTIIRHAPSAISRRNRRKQE